MKDTERRLTRVVAATSGILAAALLPAGAASADEYDFSPDVATFVPSQVEGYPPLINEVTGAEIWHFNDATTNEVNSAFDMEGVATQTTIGTFSNDDFLTTSGLISITMGHGTFELPLGTQIDLANFGLGFGNEWLDIPSGTDMGISDLLITPFGDFEVFGTGFSELSTVLAP